MVRITMTAFEFDSLRSILLEHKIYTINLMGQTDPISKTLAEIHLENIEHLYDVLTFNKEFIDKPE